MAISTYVWLKHAHVSLVGLSYLLFVARGAVALNQPLSASRKSRFVVHLVDTGLLLCGVSLAILLHLNPVHVPWLGAKIIGLMVYIVVGSVAIRQGKSFRARLSAWLFAQALFFYIVLVAWTKSPTLGFS
ncbi:MAG: SirB2 family protein [Fluviibacter sp.]